MGQGETFQCVKIHQRKAIRCYCPSIPPDKLHPKIRREREKKSCIDKNILFCQNFFFFFTDTGGKKKWFPRPFVAVLTLLWSSLHLQKQQQKTLAVGLHIQR